MASSLGRLIATSGGTESVRRSDASTTSKLKTMRICYLVEITNCLDSSVITRLVTVDSEDKDAVNNIEALIDLYVELDKFDCQAISKIYRVEPINISIE